MKKTILTVMAALFVLTVVLTGCSEKEPAAPQVPPQTVEPNE